jgi:hypothetical protein
MRYRSNLEPPDMSGFKLSTQVLQNCGHDIPSDPDFDPNCGFMAHDELAILYATLKSLQLKRKSAVDIGARVGWTAKAIHAATGGCVLCVDPILKYGSLEQQRFKENLGPLFGSMIALPYTAAQFFTARIKEATVTRYSAFVIDGNHEDDEPLNDCAGALDIATDDCVILLHDGRGLPIQKAVHWLLNIGFHARFYFTPAGMFVCWRGFDGWAPPDHDRDPRIDWRGIENELWKTIPKERLS